MLTTLEYWFWRALIGCLTLLTCLPRAWRSGFFAALGRWVFACLPRRRRVIATNLAWCFPEMSEAQRAALLRSNFESMGLGLMETLLAWRLSDRDIHASVEVDEDTMKSIEVLLEKADRGVLFVSAHFTAMELALRTLAAHLPIGVIQRRVNARGLDRIIYEKRSRYSDPVLYKREGLRRMAKVLRSGRSMGVLVDQDMGLSMGVFAPFMGLQAATVTLPSRMQRLTGCAVVYTHCLRTEDGGYRLTLNLLNETFVEGHDVEAGATIVNTSIEAGIRECPDQYYWCHRRFKTQPEGSTYRYPR